MEYKKIEYLVYNQNLINKNLYSNKKDYYLKLDEMLINNLQKCINKNIPLEINEEELSKIYKIYLKLLKNNYNIENNFINKLINLSQKKLDYLALIREITE